ncbi:hypothetical protein WICPIJ_005316 [Wickerhamomyces pijperi]|uniref:AAA+ ATPase domain-containing protein n=1 Tax=Wickerhamomyces pijperi TaxID=599730 RepID=A0A9P8Q5Z2_WICPI|nr:hypothetical protein WICPIJ_005316 [Wickerhamomyces pijperi]
MLLGQTKVFQDIYSTGENLVYYSSRMNDSQKRIVAHALHGENAVTLVQGPPGTGKTTVIVELVRQFLPNDGKSYSNKILLCAQTNAAVDNVCEGLLKMRVADILRIVPAVREDDYPPEHAIGSVCLHNLVNPLLSECTRCVLRVLKSGTKADKKALSKKEIKSALAEKSKISSAFIKGSKILITTAIGCKSPIIVNNIVNIPVVIMDEATQCNVPTSLVPFSMPGLKKIVIVGDDKQLSGFSEIPYLEKSLFVRLQETKMVVPLMLDTQYRMHPDISSFSRNKFYNGELLDGIGAKHRTLDIPGLPKPLTFITYGHKYQESIILQPSPVTGIVAPSYRNRSEATIVVETIKKLISKGQFTQDRIAIITPYAPQRDLLALLIMKDKVLNPLGLKIKEEGMNTGNDENDLESVSLQRKSSTGKPPTVMTVNGISISSVDAYQGREQDVVIFSCVRSNRAGRIGFLSDARRLNVALTRARYGLIMVGNRFCLRSGDPLWEDLMTHFDNNGAIITDVNRYLGLDRRGRKIVPRDGGNGFTYASNDIIGDAGETVELRGEEDGEDGYFVELSDDEGASQSDRGSRIVDHVADGIAEMQLMARDI